MPRVRLSVRSLMALVLVFGAGFGWVVHRAHVQRDAVAAIERIGGRAFYDWQSRNRRPDPNGQPRAPKWLVDMVGIDFFHGVNLVNFKHADRGKWVIAMKLADAGHPELLQRLPAEPPSVSDAGLSQLRRLTSLRRVILNSTDVTDAGLVHLEGLTGIEELDLSATKVTDAGLAHLNGLTGLRYLFFNDTRVTDAGLAHLSRLTGLQFLYLDGTRVTDAGLKHLGRLTGLKGLGLRGSKVTDAGVAAIRQALPGTRLTR
jgi:hypothetical protein